MIILQPENPILLADRTNTHIVYSSEEKDFEKTLGSRFVMAVGSELQSEEFSIKGVFAAVVNDSFKIKSGHYLVIHTMGYTAQEQRLAKISGDPMAGNLSYIDGCSNSNLIDPARNGDPCLNYLFFPHSIKQSQHTHPSYRIGLVVGGAGMAWTPKSSSGTETHGLSQNKAFLLPRHEMHYFQTMENPMGLMVFHPDSEDGPRDEFNPMKTRTYLK